MSRHPSYPVLVLFMLFGIGFIAGVWWSARLPRPGPAIMLTGAALLCGVITLSRLVDEIAECVSVESPHAVLVLGQAMRVAAIVAGALVLLGALNAVDAIPFAWPSVNLDEGSANPAPPSGGG